MRRRLIAPRRLKLYRREAGTRKAKLDPAKFTDMEEGKEAPADDKLLAAVVNAKDQLAISVSMYSRNFYVLIEDFSDQLDYLVERWRRAVTAEDRGGVALQIQKIEREMSKYLKPHLKSVS